MFASKVGVIGNRWSIETLRAGIRRTRGRYKAGSRTQAEILANKIRALADRRWARVCSGQRVPTPKQAVDAAMLIRGALTEAQGRCSQRLLYSQAIINLASKSDSEGLASTNGGTVSCGSYGYRWGTTSAHATRRADGSVVVSIDRTQKRSITLPAKTWQSITLDYGVLKGGGFVGIRRKHGWDCYDDDARKVGVAIPVTDHAVKSLWGAWEHGATVEDAKAETARKVEILAAAADEQRKQARTERAARLLARIGTRTTVGYDDARKAGACDAGLRAFAARNGYAMDAKIPLSVVATIEPAWAVRMARSIVRERMHV